ncbi:hypothetical protein AGMMS49574_28380 [Bacteroidia bacterium]|nr:hypothetical protein AGMMS49574_28380 [Bacteroidia bacterium]
MYKLTITLKQHTPLIHFQHEQDGATLRATEVKPKLDRFIKNRLRELDKSLYDEYKDLIDLIPDKTNKIVSPYKLSIVQEENTTDKFVIASFIPQFTADAYRQGYNVLDRTPYFADNKCIKDKNTKDAKLGIGMKTDKFLSVTFGFRDSRWEDFIKRVIPYFFASTNFGARQSKGFGCFYPQNISQSEFEKYLRSNSKIAFKSKPQKNLYAVYSEIDLLTKKLKSGTQGRDGELRKYFNRLRPVVEWEKPAIQKQISELLGQNFRIDSKTNNRQFLRACLGLPELYEYPRNNGMKVSIEHLPQSDAGLDKKIERYPSPILFKVYDNTVYLILDSNITEYQSDILAEDFKFEFKDRNRTYQQSIHLSTPEKFDIEDFINTAMNSQPNWRELT